MNIKIMGRDEALYYTFRQDLDEYIMISINCPDENAPIFYVDFKEESKRLGTLRLWLEDLNEPYHNREPKQKDMIGLKAFIDTFKNDNRVKDIIIHCTAGISRSPAVAAAICKYLNLDEYNTVWNNEKYIPNELVYRLACNEFGLKISEPELEFYKAINKGLKTNKIYDKEIEDMFI